MIVRETSKGNGIRGNVAAREADTVILSAKDSRALALAEAETYP